MTLFRRPRDQRGPDPAQLGGPTSASPADGFVRSGTVVIALAMIVSVLTTVGAVLVTDSGPAGAHSPPTVEIKGGGWGHGRGMGQYGAFGYAAEFGWSSRRILNHYYRGTTQGRVPQSLALDPDRLRVELSTLAGRSTTVALQEGAIVMRDSRGNRLRRVTAGSVRLTAGAGGFKLELGAGCLGPWSDDLFLPHAQVDLVAQPPDNPDPTLADSSARLLQVCGPYYRSWYEGTIRAVSHGGRQHTVNVVSVEQYLRGVVPNEMPASWPEAALQAQAVAARSYALAGDSRWGSYADTCDSTWCQVYDGRFTTRGQWRRSTHERTDAAIAATAGQVRLRPDGAVARTEFSSSTGGYTAGGDFPAVPDAGDSIADNPNHRWTVTRNVSYLEARYGLGAIKEIVVVDRTGQGPFGGRAAAVEFRFERGTKTLKGWDARSLLDLKSDLFTVGPVTRAQPGTNSLPDPQPVANPTSDEDSSQPAPDGDAIIDELYQRLAGRLPSDAERSQWRRVLAQDPQLGRQRLARELVYSDHFAGVLIDDLYRIALGRKADPEGRTYWVRQLARGVPYAKVGTNFFGSAEYFRRAGNTNRDFVTALYVGILNRPPDGPGLRYWTDQLRAGSSTAKVAASFFESTESRRSRAQLLYRRAAGRSLSPAGAEVGAERLLTMSDLDLAVDYANG